MADREIIDSFEMLYGVRTGLTVLLAPVRTLEVPVDVRVQFTVDGQGKKQDMIVSANGREAVLKDVPAYHVEQAMRHGVIMFYEMEGDDVVRCTPCYKA